jgi:hypothetical protein
MSEETTTLVGETPAEAPETTAPRGRKTLGAPPARPRPGLTELGTSGALSFRQQAALAILTAYVQRHGGLGSPVESAGNARQIWRFADLFVAAENAAEPVEAQQEAPALLRPAAPDDEWGVRDTGGGKQKRGFVSRAEAEAYAAAHPGSKVVQISGPGAGHVAPATA